MTFDNENPMRHHLFTLGCFGAAITLYVLGEQQHAGLLIARGRAQRTPGPETPAVAQGTQLSRRVY